MSDLENLPECFLQYPRSIEPNSCKDCSVRRLCEVASRRVKRRFVPKALLEEVDRRLAHCLRIIRGD